MWSITDALVLEMHMLEAIFSKLAPQFQPIGPNDSRFRNASHKTVFINGENFFEGLQGAQILNLVVEEKTLASSGWDGIEGRGSGPQNASNIRRRVLLEFSGTKSGGLGTLSEQDTSAGARSGSAPKERNLPTRTPTILSLGLYDHSMYID
ncbi:uncharacterized protein BT62DRAFT_1073089 [Guyanagaster necrorhizus]|uniref:Uncharacterized protein n=1 Tax=Guyanagaster necrorhizus TaxID=856835 RepID=A0A9P7VY18_9AGAR|nr:uncharacterized protein BT62DRAFT_1073089 [Guyanagaster necrorhizus MCA 3950]KAG7449656.1 hypothetical protein BT62DRAFT_1073089 [Guyanagaster necrorhizus MCA 3950]